MKMKKTYAKLLIFMAMAAALIGCPPTAVRRRKRRLRYPSVPTEESEPWRIRMRQSEWRRR